MKSRVLTIQHIPATDPPQFRIVRGRDGKATAQPVAVPSPVDFPVEGRPGRGLVDELRWYLETFLDYPFPPETDHAERVQQAVGAWGRKAFSALFGDRESGRLFDEAARPAAEELELRVSSDDPRILGWPWEGLVDPQGGRLAAICRIQRQLNDIPDPSAVSDQLPRDRIAILLITARPYEGDVQYRSISRPIVSLLRDRQLPAEVTLLRPPTFKALRQHLHDHRNRYHIVHFDGHGSYGEGGGDGGPHSMLGVQGQLVFETEEGKPDPITATQLTDLLKEYRIPAVVLNACQSAMIDARAEDAFASVAAALLRAGIRSVVAMSYSLYVSAAVEFLPSFYRRLFESGSFAEATRAGRQQLLAAPGRVCARGKFPLDDWLVPVVYEQDPLDLSFAKAAGVGGSPVSTIPPILPPASPHGLIGRDGAILALERALFRKPAGLLVRGLGGIGKTTLASGFVEWLLDTHGLEPGRVVWLSFHEIRSAEYVVNRMGEAVFGASFGAIEEDRKLLQLVAALREKRFLIVWDNFEDVRGIEGTEVAAKLSDADQAVLRSLLAQLRGGETKVLITSRRDEEWLGPTNRFLVPLGGLKGEELWAYCAILLDDLGLAVDRNDEELVHLLDLLGGHPLAMRVILPRLVGSSAKVLATTLEARLAEEPAGTDAEEARLFATLSFAAESIPEDLRPLLELVSLHERCVLGNSFAAIAKEVDPLWTRPRIDQFLRMMCSAGLLTDIGHAVYESHPLLSRYLRARLVPTPSERWVRPFVELVAAGADDLASRELHETRAAFTFLGETFRSAIGHAERLGLTEQYAALTQSLADYAYKTRNFKDAWTLFERLSTCDGWECAAYHHMGMVAQEKLDFGVAETCYRQSLAISEKTGEQGRAAATWYQLGRLAQEKNDRVTAEEYWRKASGIFEKLGDDVGMGRSYHQLGIAAAWRGAYGEAEGLYKESIAIKERHGDELGAAASYHQLGIVVGEQGDIDAAKHWLQTALTTFEKFGVELHAAATYHQLGILAQQQEEWSGAEALYLRAIAIEEKHGAKPAAALSYLQLGNLALRQGDVDRAEQWYRRALEVYEMLGDEYGRLDTHLVLGRVAAVRGRFIEAAAACIKCIGFFAEAHDERRRKEVLDLLLLIHADSSSVEQAQVRTMWDEAGLGPWPGKEGWETVSDSTFKQREPTALRVFVSYSSHDVEAAAEVVAALDQPGVNLWFDRREVQPGDSFLDLMNKGLTEASYVLLIWSRSADASHWVKQEYLAALASKRIVVIPVIIESVQLPPLLDHLHHVDLTRDRQRELGRLREFFATEQQTAVASAESPVADRREAAGAPPAFGGGSEAAPSLRGLSRRDVRLVLASCLSNADLQKYFWDLELSPGEVQGDSVNDRLVWLLHSVERNGELQVLLEYVARDHRKCVAHQIRQLSGR